MKLPILALTFVLTLAGTYQAKASSFVIDMYQDGSNVVATGSGDIDLTGLTFVGNEASATGNSIEAKDAKLIMGTSVPDYSYYAGLSNTSSLGSGPYTRASSGSGGLIYVNGLTSHLGLSEDYTSGSALSNTAMWDDTTLSGLGVTPGVYTWTWDSGADSITLDASVAVPEPSQYGLGIVLALAGLIAFRRFRTTLPDTAPTN